MPGRQHARAGLGDALDDAGNFDSGSDPLLNQLHGLALSIVAERAAANAILSKVSDADAEISDSDWFNLSAHLANIVTLQQQFRAAAAQRTAQDPYALSVFDNAILAVGDWASGVLSWLPTAIAAVPNAVIDGLTKVVQNTGKDAAAALLPFGAIAVGLVGLLLLAEKSHTVRRVAA